jgi:hypothetical protein
MFDNRGVILRVSAIPLAAFGFVVNFHDGLARGGDDPAGVEL